VSGRAGEQVDGRLSGHVDGRAGEQVDGRLGEQVDGRLSGRASKRVGIDGSLRAGPMSRINLGREPLLDWPALDGLDPYPGELRARRRRPPPRRHRRRGQVLLVLGAAALLAIVAAIGSGGSDSPSSGRQAGQLLSHDRGRSAASGGGGADRSATANGGATRSPRSRDTSVASAAEQDAAVRGLARLGKPIYCAGRRGNMIALTFDDGPGPYTTLAFRKLRQNHDRATFFVVGNSMRQHGTRLLPRELAFGAVGDHTQTHPVLPALSASAIHDQLASAKETAERATGAPVLLFRPPYGARNAEVDRQAQELGLLEVVWDVDSRDSLGANYAAITANVLHETHPGSIILMHENRGQTIRAMLELLPALRRRHLRAVSLPELLAADPPSQAQLRAGRLGCGTGAGGRR
jgi:peptidoglycan/xylan/chitin deacetylase (PgdA/CDA1 family)